MIICDKDPCQRAKSSYKTWEIDIFLMINKLFDKYINLSLDKVNRTVSVGRKAAGLTSK